MPEFFDFPNWLLYLFIGACIFDVLFVFLVLRPGKRAEQATHTPDDFTVYRQEREKRVNRAKLHQATSWRERL